MLGRAPDRLFGFRTTGSWMGFASLCNGRSVLVVKFFFPAAATLAPDCVYPSLSNRRTMERIREADRSQLIRLCTLAFALLALVSFLLARVTW